MNGAGVSPPSFDYLLTCCSQTDMENAGPFGRLPAQLRNRMYHLALIHNTYIWCSENSTAYASKGHVKLPALACKVSGSPRRELSHLLQYQCLLY